MRSTMVSPSATRPAMTRLAEARRSVAITVAPDRRGTPSITATLPSTWILAPRRTSSLTCMKRFSKIVSVTVAVPWAMQLSAMNWACMSVGKPGYSVVRKPWALSVAPPVLCTRMPPSTACTLAPASRSFSMTASRWSARPWRSTTSPPVAATAHRKVPASMRSATTRWVQPCSFSTPWMRMRLVPWPSIFAPMAISISARSEISGSCAAFSSTVSPSASAAAIMKFSVPVTVTMSVVMRAPFRRFHPAGSLAIM